ncbi:MAG: hypothetical protein ACRDPQ_01525 [Nocardioidaceae bacterium]
MSNPQAVGLNEVGGVTKGANQTVDVQSGNAQHARNTQSTADMLAGRNFGPASRVQYASMLAQAGAGNVRARHSAEYAEKKAMGERQAVQGHEDSTQTYTTAANQADTTFGSLNRPL